MECFALRLACAAKIMENIPAKYIHAALKEIDDHAPITSYLIAIH